MSNTRITGPTSLRDAYRRIRDRVSETLTRCGRSPKDAIIVAVATTATPDALRQLIELGHTDLGETRANALVQRAVALEEFLGRKRFLTQSGVRPGAPRVPAKGEVRWHVVGPVQRQRVKQVIPLVRLIHTVDSLRLAEELHGLAARMEPRRTNVVPEPIPVLLQINASGDPSQPGVVPPAAKHLAEQIDTMVHLQLRGLMAATPRSDQPEDSRDIFARCRELFEDIRTTGVGGDKFNILSMGDSHDFEVALEEGANIIRIGRALFGDSEDAEIETV